MMENDGKWKTSSTGYRCGDVVRLNGANKKMTILHLEGSITTRWWHCVWLDTKDSLCKASFPEIALTKVDDDQ